jgi:hypothetical protein
MMSTWTWISDVVLMLLLGGTFVMALRLDRALRIVRRDRAAFEALITSLSSATNAVKQGIQKLREEAERSGEHVERRSADADRMATDLSFLIERAERAGGRLETSLREVVGLAPRATDNTDTTVIRETPARGPAKAAREEPARSERAARSSTGTRRLAVRPAPAPKLARKGGK